LLTGVRSSARIPWTTTSSLRRTAPGGVGDGDGWGVAGTAGTAASGGGLVWAWTGDTHTRTAIARRAGQWLFEVCSRSDHELRPDGVGSEVTSSDSPRGESPAEGDSWLFECGSSR
jgi:hypothetical protein